MKAGRAFVNVDAYSGVVAGVVVPRLADALCDVVFNDAEAVGVTARVGAGVVAGVEGNHLTAHRKPYLLTIQRDQIGLLLYGLGNKFSFEVVQIFSKILGHFEEGNFILGNFCEKLIYIPFQLLVTQPVVKNKARLYTRVTSKLVQS